MPILQIALKSPNTYGKTPHEEILGKNPGDLSFLNPTFAPKIVRFLKSLISNV